MSQILHGTYLYSTSMCRSSETQIQLGILYFYLLNLTTLDKVCWRGQEKTRNEIGCVTLLGFLCKLNLTPPSKQSWR